MRLISGGVDLRKLTCGLFKAAQPSSAPSSLAEELRLGLSEFTGPVRILLADGDRTAQVFADRWDADDARIARCPGADHAYSSAEASAWLRARLLEALRA